MLNGLDLLIFRLKAKELIYTVLYKCRLLEYTILTTPKRIIAVAIASDNYGDLPAKSRLRQLFEYDWKDYGLLLGALGNRIWVPNGSLQSGRVGRCCCTVVRNPPANHVWGNYSNMTERITVLMRLGALGTWIWALSGCLQSSRVGRCCCAVVRKIENIGDVVHVTR